MTIKGKEELGLEQYCTSCSDTVSRACQRVFRACGTTGIAESTRSTSTHLNASQRRCWDDHTCCCNVPLQGKGHSLRATTAGWLRVFGSSSQPPGQLASPVPLSKIARGLASCLRCRSEHRATTILQCHSYEERRQLESSASLNSSKAT